MKFQDVHDSFAFLHTHVTGTSHPREARFKFVVEGSGEEPWLVELTSEGGGVSRGDGVADLTITLAPETLLDIVNGAITMEKAFFLRRFRTEGDLAMGVYLRGLLKSAARSLDTTPEPRPAT